MEKILNLILEEQKRQGNLIHQLINTVAATNVKVTEMNGEITEIKGEINEINGKIAAIETKLDSVSSDVKEIKDSMATKHDLEYYDQMISEHSRQIYKLKNH